eukprot:scaffold2657_cov368-Pavlova_lutheri.AAC.15
MQSTRKAVKDLLKCKGYFLHPYREISSEAFCQVDSTKFFSVQNQNMASRRTMRPTTSIGKYSLHSKKS